MKNILDAIGNTPLIKINNIYAKLESVNPSGSIKDRIAKYMTTKAEERGELLPGYTIIEATSGNTGVSLAMVAAFKGYKMVAVMPENTSKQKKLLMKIFGCEIVLTPQKENLLGTIKMAEHIAKQRERIWLPRQFGNSDNIEAHRQGLGQEILREIDGIDAFVTGIGTGGTLMGVAKALKPKFPNIKIFGVEAVETPHQIEGISDGIIPKILDFDLIDGMIKIRSKDAIAMAKKLAREQGLLVGISSGANVLAAAELNKRYKNVVTVLPDRGERYLNSL